MVDYDVVAKALQFLEKKGWSDLIDKRWKKDVTNDLKEAFPDMDKETLGHILECVIF